MTTNQAPSCAACGETNRLYWHVYAPDIGNASLCSCASGYQLDENIARVRARRWLSSGPVGTGNAQSSVPGGVKRFGESEEFCASCGEGGGYFKEVPCEMAGNGKWYCECCIDGAREHHGVPEECDEPVATAAPTHCPECPTALTPETVGRAPFCRVCTERRWPMVTMKAPCSECRAPAEIDSDNGMCAYCVTSTGHGDEHRDEQDRIMRFSTDRHHGAEARARNEAAMAQAERPSGNRAERAMLAAGHPVGWPSIGDDEP